MPLHFHVGKIENDPLPVVFKLPGLGQVRDDFKVQFIIWTGAQQPVIGGRGNDIDPAEGGLVHIEEGNRLPVVGQEGPAVSRSLPIRFGQGEGTALHKNLCRIAVVGIVAGGRGCGCLGHGSGGGRRGCRRSRDGRGRRGLCSLWRRGLGGSFRGFGGCVITTTGGQHGQGEDDSDGESDAEFQFAEHSPDTSAS